MSNHFLLSHHHSTSALVSEILMSVLQTVQKNNRQFTYGQTVQKNNKQFTYGQTVQKTTNNLPMDRQCKKTTNNLPMDRQCKKTALEHLQCSRQCKKKKQQFTYGQTVQKKLHWSIYSAPDSAKKNNSNLHMDRQCKKNNSNLHMDRQCKNNSNLHMDSTYLQTVQKTMCKIHIHILSTLSVL